MQWLDYKLLQHHKYENENYRVKNDNNALNKIRN